MNIEVGQVWRIVRTKMDSSAEKRMMLLVEERRRAGKRWYWAAMDVETGVVTAITPWECGPDWKWERFA